MNTMAEKTQSTRREFLQGKAAANALVDFTQGVPGDASSAEPSLRSAAPYLVHVGRRAMACQFEAFLNAGQYSHGTEAAIAALDLVDVLEAQMTVYRDDSEISRINQTAAAEPVAVESRLLRLLARGVELFEQTEGAYDITSGPLSKIWGFFRRAGSIPQDSDLAHALACVGSQHLQIDLDSDTIRFAKPGVEINLGSIGKGYALDRSAELLESEGLADFLCHGGQSSVLARGSQGGQEGWLVGLRHPMRADRRLAEIRLRDRALGTSGSGTQFFLHEGRRYGHILDPRTGRPADRVLSSTVIAKSAADADALSTAFYVMGVEAAFEYCSTHPDIAAILVRAGQGGMLEIDSIGLADDDWRVLSDG